MLGAQASPPASYVKVDLNGSQQAGTPALPAMRWLFLPTSLLKVTLADGGGCDHIVNRTHFAHQLIVLRQRQSLCAIRQRLLWLVVYFDN